MTSQFLRTPSKADDIFNDFQNFRHDLKKNYE